MPPGTIDCVMRMCVRYSRYLVRMSECVWMAYITLISLDSVYLSFSLISQWPQSYAKCSSHHKVRRTYHIYSLVGRERKWLDFRKIRQDRLSEAEMENKSFEGGLRERKLEPGSHLGEGEKNVSEQHQHRSHDSRTGCFETQSVKATSTKNKE